jgi:hypothetical protein
VRAKSVCSADWSVAALPLKIGGADILERITKVRGFNNSNFAVHAQDSNFAGIECPMSKNARSPPSRGRVRGGTFPHSVSIPTVLPKLSPVSVLVNAPAILRDSPAYLLHLSTGTSVEHLRLQPNLG